jgi:uridine kinase
MVDRQDWIDWDNSMKAHYDQIDVTWKNDQLLAWKQQQDINRSIHSFNDSVIVAIEELHKEQNQNRRMIAICGILMALNIIVGFIAIMEAIRG